MKRCISLGLPAVASLSVLAWAAQAQQQRPNVSTAGTESGFAVFQTKCMGCHGNPAMADRAPSPATLREMTPEKIYGALTDGPMKVQGSSLSEEQRRMVAVFMSGKTFGAAEQGDAKTMPNRCEANPPMADPAESPRWNG